MNEPYNGQHPALTPAQRKPKRHNAKLCPLVIRERIINALAAGDSHRAIARALRVSPNTVTAVAEEEWRQVDARKTRIAAQSERNATRAAELIAQKLERDDVPLNVLVPVFGVSVDKSLALRGDASLNLSLDHHHIHEIDRRHIHEFVDRHIRQVPIQQVLDSLPDGRASSPSHADTPRTAG